MVSLVFKEQTREELDKLIRNFTSFKEHFDRGLHVQSGHAVADLQIQVKSLLNKAGKRLVI